MNKRVPRGRDTARELTQLHNLYTMYSNDIVKYLPDTHAALYADVIVHVWSGRQADSMLQRTEMVMLIWTRKPINSSLRTAKLIYM